MKDIMMVEIEKLQDEFFSYVNDLYLHPELGNEEIRSSKLLADILVKYGFDTACPYLLKTDFKGVYKSKKNGPKIGYLCEYDALPEVGHGCGHNMIGVISILAAVALKKIIDEIGGEIHVFGTPAEENFGGKVDLAKLHAFDDMDCCMMLHPSDKNGTGGKTLALIPVRYEFFGKSAHGAKPYDGASALDAAIQTYQGLSMLRQFLKGNYRIHGVISNGGKAANVIPEHTVLDYYFRADTIDYARYIQSRALEVAKGAAMMTGTKVKESIYECIYEDTKINYTLANELEGIYHSLGLEDVGKVNEEPSGSSDVGAVSYVCPTIQGYIKIAPTGTRGHSLEFASCTISKEGKLAMVNGAKALAILAYNLITNKELLENVKKEFNK